MKKKQLAALGIVLTMATSTVLASCGASSSKTWKYPNRENTVLAEGEFSWEKWKEECPNGLTINWYSDTYINISNKSVVTKAIKEKTGITINFDTQVGATDKLNLMISGDTLPDVVTLETSDSRFRQLGDQGYLFPINGLAERWAPSLEINEDILHVYGRKDGNIYGLPSYYYYTDEDDNTILETNGGMMVRMDYYRAYMEYVIDNVPEKDQAAWDITTPDGAIKAMKWVRDNCLTEKEKDVFNAFLLDPFDMSRNNGNQGLAWLCQYFAIPFEAENGDYQDGIDTDEYIQMLTWLNELYREELLTEITLSNTTTADVGKIIANGNTFIVCGTPQNYPTYLASAAFPTSGEPIEYGSFVIKNYDGKDPVLGDIAGTGYQATCITKNAKRPDIIIKLFDYLWSDEGQMLCNYGIQAEVDASGNVTGIVDPDFAKVFTNEEATWYVSKDGEVKRTKFYKDKLLESSNGDIEAEEYLDHIGTGDWKFFYRPSFIDGLNTGKVSATKQSAYVNNMKKPLNIYSASYHIAGGLLDMDHPNYINLVRVNSQINGVWSPIVRMMITAESKEAVLKIFQNGRKRLTAIGHDDLYVAYNETYRNKKEKFGVAYGYPHNDPNYQPAVINEYYTWTNPTTGKTYTDIFGARGDVSCYRDYEIIG
ncbi:MAG: extracellular solute-binding protein [Clostridia bacterium]|nr:extracellular solute-binding protein [Clostridia bacterium]